MTSNLHHNILELCCHMFTGPCTVKKKTCVMKAAWSSRSICLCSGLRRSCRRWRLQTSFSENFTLWLNPWSSTEKVSCIGFFTLLDLTSAKAGTVWKVTLTPISSDYIKMMQQRPCAVHLLRKVGQTIPETLHDLLSLIAKLIWTAVKRNYMNFK